MLRRLITPAVAMWLVGALLSMGTPASALDAGQTAAIDRIAASPPPGKSRGAALAPHYALLLWIEDYCNGRSDESVRGYIMQKAAGDDDAFEAGWAEAIELLTKTPAVAMCPLALEQYGPDGAMIKGAWAPKG